MNPRFIRPYWNGTKERQRGRKQQAGGRLVGRRGGWAEEEAEVRCFLTSHVAAQCHYTCANAHVKTCAASNIHRYFPKREICAFTGKLNIADCRCLGAHCGALKSIARERLAPNRISFVPCWPSYTSGEYGEQGNMVTREACPRTGASDRYSLFLSVSPARPPSLSLFLLRCDRFTKTSSFSERPLSD